ncbi:hypothetical protein LLE87_38050, partial [Paenibacillus polymyxa]|nr:hypothetical protein [Paenibacillus polymyxa]
SRPAGAETSVPPTAAAGRHLSRQRRSADAVVPAKGQDLVHSRQVADQGGQRLPAGGAGYSQRRGRLPSV